MRKVRSDAQCVEEFLLRDYFSNLGQFVTDEDAKRMALSLESALPDIPDHDALGSKLRRNALPRRIASWERIIPGPVPPPSRLEAVNAFEWFSGKEKRRLVSFVNFCKRGGFFIN